MPFPKTAADRQRAVKAARVNEGSGVSYVEVETLFITLFRKQKEFEEARITYSEAINSLRCLYETAKSKNESFQK